MLSQTQKAKSPSPTVKPVLIVGAGPAGMTAAITLARHGARSVVVDEHPTIGGLVYRQPQRRDNTALSIGDDKVKQRAKALFEAFDEQRAHIDLKLGASVVGVQDGSSELLVQSDGALGELHFDRLIVATGCFERAQPFPGWTLPGVLSVGGAQLQVKSGLVRPGTRVVLAGTGPLLLVAALQLHQAGVVVAGVFEAGSRTALLRHPLRLLANTALLFEGAHYLSQLRAAKIPVRFGWGIVEAHGDEALSSVTVAPYDADWRPRRDRTLTIEADCLGVGYGYVSRTQLTQLLGCKHEYSSFDGGWLPAKDRLQRSSRAGVYVAGDVAGVFGSQTAALEGELAGLGCLVELGILSEPQALEKALAASGRLNALRSFRRAFDGFSALRPGLLTLAKPDTIVCRCEHVAMKEIEAAIDGGATTLTRLKMATRVGMGDCQGKMCGSFCAELLMARAHVPAEEVGMLRPRFPLAPMVFGTLLNKEEIHA